SITPTARTGPGGDMARAENQRAEAPGPVRAVGVIEAPIAALVGRTLFREKLTARQLAAGMATALGMVMTALN
ncbi:MAG: hypothetical protein WCJ52_10345, partial [Phenylobacterium sp.]